MPAHHAPPIATPPDPARTSASTQPSWFATAAAPPAFTPLRADTRAAVVVIGAGIAGLITAYLLGKAGQRTVVLEDGEIASVAADCTELLTGGNVASASEIAPGSGAVLRPGLSKVVVYKDAQGQMHTCSVICPHLGCAVHCNDLETS